jgi:hypothetical protein
VSERDSAEAFAAAKELIATRAGRRGECHRQGLGGAFQLTEFGLETAELDLGERGTSNGKSRGFRVHAHMWVHVACLAKHF